MRHSLTRPADFVAPAECHQVDDVPTSIQEPPERSHTKSSSPFLNGSTTLPVEEHPFEALALELPQTQNQIHTFSHRFVKKAPKKIPMPVSARDNNDHICAQFVDKPSPVPSPAPRPELLRKNGHPSPAQRTDQNVDSDLLVFIANGIEPKTKKTSPSTLPPSFQKQRQQIRTVLAFGSMFEEQQVLENGARNGLQDERVDTGDENVLSCFLTESAVPIIPIVAAAAPSPLPVPSPPPLPRTTAGRRLHGSMQPPIVSDLDALAASAKMLSVPAAKNTSSPFAAEMATVLDHQLNFASASFAFRALSPRYGGFSTPRADTLLGNLPLQIATSNYPQELKETPVCMLLSVAHTHATQFVGSRSRSKKVPSITLPPPKAPAFFKQTL
jgi:hypothetical protein